MIIMAGCPITLLCATFDSAKFDGEALLFLSELRSYLQVEIIAWLSKCSMSQNFITELKQETFFACAAWQNEDHIVVDTTLNQKLPRGT